MPATYEPIATTTLGSAASSITFSSIPSTYTDLRVVLVTKTTSGNADIYLRFNSDSGSNYSRTILYGTGSVAGSGRNTSQTYLYLTGTAYPNASYAALVEADIFSYAGSTYKTLLNKVATDKNGAGGVEANVGLWRSTSAITSITLTLEASAQDFPTGTTATLYGIKSA